MGGGDFQQWLARGVSTEQVKRSGSHELQRSLQERTPRCPGLQGTCGPVEARDSKGGQGSDTYRDTHRLHRASRMHAPVMPSVCHRDGAYALNEEVREGFLEEVTFE